MALVHVALSKLSGLVVLLPTAPAPIHPGKVCVASIVWYCLPIVLDDTHRPCSASLVDKARCRSSALLGQGDDDGDENGEDGDGSVFSLGSFRPGKVVWAKVDGHEWWPAKVRTHTCNCSWAAAYFAWSVSLWKFDHSPQHFASCYTSRACEQSLLRHHVC